MRAVLEHVDVALIVTTPSPLSQYDAARVVKLLCEKGVPIAGELRNMCGVKCPSCGTTISIFEGGSSPLGIPLIAEIPFVRVENGCIPREHFPLEKIVDALNSPAVKSKKLKPVKKLLKSLLKKMLS